MSTVRPDPPVTLVERAGVRATALWWTTPVGGLAMIVPASLLLAVVISDADYRLFYGTPRYMTGASAALFALMAVCLAAGTLVPRALDRIPPWPEPDAVVASQFRVFSRAERVAFGLTVGGYVALGLIGAARGATPADLINAVVQQSNNSGQLEDLFAPVAGVSSFTQIGIAQVTLAALLVCQGADRAVRRRLVIVLVLGAIRAFVLTERLALIELLLPVVLIMVTFRFGSAVRRRVARLFPILALPALLVFFGAFEYSRSWTFYRTRTDLTFPEFVVRRLAGYYATAYNNGAIELQHPPPGSVPYASFEAFWTAPGISQLNLYGDLGGGGDTTWLIRLITRFGNPEFNNPGGLAVPIVDLGAVGAALYFLLIGLAIGVLYRSWRAMRPAGLLLYPLAFTGVLEIPRYVYWTQGRAFPAIVFLVITAMVCRRQQPLVTTRDVQV